VQYLGAGDVTGSGKLGTLGNHVDLPTLWDRPLGWPGWPGGNLEVSGRLSYPEVDQWTPVGLGRTVLLILFFFFFSKRSSRGKGCDGT